MQLCKGEEKILISWVEGANSEEDNYLFHSKIMEFVNKIIQTLVDDNNRPGLRDLKDKLDRRLNIWSLYFINNYNKK